MRTTLTRMAVSIAAVGALTSGLGLVAATHAAAAAGERIIAGWAGVRDIKSR